MLTADVNDIWTPGGIEEITRSAQGAQGGIAFLQDAAMTCTTSPNLAAALAGGACVTMAAVPDFLRRITGAMGMVMQGCEHLRARRFNEQIKSNYKIMTGLGLPLHGTAMHPIRLMLDQAVN